MALPPQQAPVAGNLTGQEWQLLIQNGKLSRAQINAIITFARTGYTTDNLPEGVANFYLTNARVASAVNASAPFSKTIVGLGNVDNTSDVNKPLSVIAQAALGGKEPTVAAGTTSQYYRGDKTWQTLNKAAVGLGNVDNTTDLSKPISTATQTALDGKMNIPGTITSRSVSFGTAYQATTITRPALLSVTVETSYTITVAGTSSDTVELRVGSDATTVANGTGGTAIATFKSSLTGITLTVGLGNIQRNQLSAILPANWYFSVRRVAGTTATIVSTFDQSF